MSAITLPAAGAVAAPFAALSRFAASVGAALDAHHDYQRLQVLTDRQLAGLGLARADLPQVVFDRHFR